MGHFLKRHKLSSSSSLYYEEMVGDYSCCLNGILCLNTFFGKKPHFPVYSKQISLYGLLEMEGLQSIWRMLQKKLSAQNFEHYLRIKKNVKNLCHNTGSATAQQYGNSEWQFRNVLSRWAVNGKEVESHPNLFPELNVISECYLRVSLKF